MTENTADSQTSASQPSLQSSEEHSSESSREDPLETPADGQTEPAAAAQTAPAPQAENGRQWVAAMPRQERHDLRNYIGQVIGYSELWLDDTAEEGETELRADLQRIYTAGKQILAMINAHVDPIHPRAEYAASSSAPVAESAALSDAAPIPPSSRHSDLAHWRASCAPDQTPAVPNDSGVAADVSANTMSGAILIVDDNEANRALLCRRLSQQGHRITAARDGQEALELLRGQDFDVLLLDILMPVLNGYETLRRIKADDRLRHIPVIMISALDEMESVIRCIEMGADDYLPKPFDPVLLQARIGASLEKKRLRDREMELFAQLHSNYQRLKELETLRDDLTHMIVHDLRTPLTSLLTGLQTLEYSESLGGDERELIDISLSGGRTLLGMINDLLDVGKMEDGSLTLDKQPIQAADLVAESLHQIAALAKDRQLTLVPDLAPGLPTFAGDAEKLTRTPRQSARQRPQILPTRRHDHGIGAPAFFSLDFRRARYRRGHSPGRFRAHFSEVRAGGIAEGGPQNVNRSGPDVLQTGGGSARGTHLGGKRIRKGQHVPVHHSIKYPS